jgi:tetratricopeptide (TPR) repeat protein
MGQTNGWLRYAAAGLALGALIILAYRPAWSGGFIWDDDYYISNNPLLVLPDGLKRIWFSLDAPSQYFPLTYTILRFERSWWGLTTTGYHLVNILLHVANALLVWRLLFRLRVPAALFAAALFGLHPIQVESVAWMTELKNVLMGFFFLLTLLAWNRFIDGKGRAWLFYGAALLLYAMALAAKTTACTLSVALVAILICRNMRIDSRRLLQIVPFAVLGTAMGLLAVWWERYHQGTRGAFFSLGMTERLLVASHAVCFYLGKLVWPVRLMFIYPQWKVRATDPIAYVWLAALLVVALLVYRLRPPLRRPIAAAVFFYLGTLGPLLGFIMLYTFRYTFVADHYQYLACIGPFALASCALVRAGAHKWYHKYITWVLGLFVIAALTALTRRQSANYRDSPTLWRATIATNPDCWMAYNNLGIDLYSAGQVTEAIHEYERSIRIHDDYAQAHYNLANALLSTGRNADALQQGRIAVELSPNDSDAHTSLGNVLLADGRLTEALVEYARACQINGDNADAQYNFGNGLQEKGDLAAAEPRYNRALQLNPAMTEAHLKLGQICWGTNRQREAIEHYTQALRLDPNSVKARLNLAWALATASDMSLRDGTRSLQLCLREADRSEDDAQALQIAAAAYAQTNQFEKAIELIGRASESAESSGAAERARELRREQRLYEMHSVYRDPTAESP